MLAVRKENQEQLMVFLKYETQMKPPFTNGEFQICKEKGFMSVTEGVGTHLVQAIFVENEWLPIGWTRVRQEPSGLTYYKKKMVEAEYVAPNQIVEIKSIDNPSEMYRYDTSTGGYILSNSKEDRYYVTIEEFDKLYTILELGEHIQVGEYILEFMMYDMEGSLEEAYEISYNGEVQGHISCIPIYEITEKYLNNFFFN